MSYEVFWTVDPPFSAEPITQPHDTRRLYVTGTLQELRARLASTFLATDWNGVGVLRTVDDYIRQVETFLESTAP